MQFRKKPVVIDAQQFDGPNGWQIAQWSAGAVIQSPVLEPTQDNPSGDYLQIPTLEGTMTAIVGDWIIRGIKGEFYPCKPDIFAATYEPAQAGPAIGKSADGPQATGSATHTSSVGAQETPTPCPHCGLFRNHLDSCEYEKFKAAPAETRTPLDTITACGLTVSELHAAVSALDALGRKQFSELREKMSLESQARAAQRTADILAEIDAETRTPHGWQATKLALVNLAAKLDAILAHPSY